MSENNDSVSGTALLTGAAQYSLQQRQTIHAIAADAEFDAMEQPDRSQRIWDIASVKALNSLVTGVARPVDFLGLANLIMGVPADFIPDGPSLNRAPLGMASGFNRSIFFKGAIAVLRHGGFFNEAAEIEVGALALYYLDRHDFERAAYMVSDAVENFEQGGRLDRAAATAIKLGRALILYGAVDQGKKYLEHGAALMAKASLQQDAAGRGAFVLAGVEALLQAERFDLAENQIRVAGKLSSDVLKSIARAITATQGDSIIGKAFFNRISLTLCVVEKLSMINPEAARSLASGEMKNIKGTDDASLIARHLLQKRLAALPSPAGLNPKSIAAKIVGRTLAGFVSFASWFSARALVSAGIDPKKADLNLLLIKADPEAAKANALAELKQSILVFERLGRSGEFAEKILSDFGPKLEALGQSRSALENYVEAEKIFRQQKKHDQAAKALLKRICVLQKMNETASVPILFKQLFDMFDQAGGEAIPFGNLSLGFQLLIEAKQPTLAFTLFSRAVALDGTTIKPNVLLDVFESALSSGNLPKEKLNQLSYSYLANAFLVLDSAENKVEAFWVAKKMTALLPIETPAQRAKKAGFLERIILLCIEQNQTAIDPDYKAKVASVWEAAGYLLDELNAVDGRQGLGINRARKTGTKVREAPPPLLLPDLLPPLERPALRMEERPTERSPRVWVAGEEIEDRPVVRDSELKRGAEVLRGAAGARLKNGRRTIK